MENLDNLGCCELENLRVEKIKELQAERNRQQQVKTAKLEKERQKIILEGEIKDLSISLSKSNHIIKQVQSDIDIITSKYWSARRNTEV